VFSPQVSWITGLIPVRVKPKMQKMVQLTLVISNSMGPWKKFESTVVRLKRSYENTGSVICLTTKGRQLEWNFEDLKPAMSRFSERFKTYSMFLLLFFFPPLLLQLLIKSNIFSKLSKLRNYTSSLIKINFRQIQM
jgi:hypothetical protein